MTTRLIKNISWVITVDAQRRMIEDGAIAIRDDRIAAVDKTSALEKAFSAEDVIDGRGLIAIPGLVDANVATVQQLGRGAADFCDIQHFMLERTLPYEASLSRENAATASRVCQLEMIRAGTTSFIDSGSRFPDAVSGVAAESGLRAMVPRACYDFFDTFMGPFPKDWPQEKTAEALERASDTIDAVRKLANERILPAIALPWLTGASDALIGGVAALAKSKNIRVVAAAARSRDEAVAARRQHGRTELERLRMADLLGPSAIVAHAGWTSPDDLVSIVRSGAHVACCPSMSQRLGSGALELGRYPELKAFGANVSLGSGSAMASNYIDVLRQLFLLAGGSKSFRLDATVVSPESVLEMATVGGAAALGLSHEIGSLEAGKKADITLFNMVSADWAPVINPIANLVFSTRGGAHTVMVDGKVLMAAGSVRTLDENAVLRDGQHAAEELAERNGLSRTCSPAWAVV